MSESDIDIVDWATGENTANIGMEPAPADKECLELGSTAIKMVGNWDGAELPSSAEIDEEAVANIKSWLEHEPEVVAHIPSKDHKLPEAPVLKLGDVYLVYDSSINNGHKYGAVIAVKETVDGEESYIPNYKLRVAGPRSLARAAGLMRNR